MNRGGALLLVRLSILIFCAPFAPRVIAKEELSLTELFNLKLPSMIVDPGANKSFDINPSSVTIITARDIELSPARDINDLIELYVPGAWWVAHSASAHPGFRGIISDRNSKFLLLVNGVVMNEKHANGVVTEMENWDLSDIERIEIIRGPGSVTFGPGAVMGVVSITTKSPSSEGTLLSTRWISAYNSRGAVFRTSLKRKHYSLAYYGSITATDGLQNPKAFATHWGTDSLPAEYGYQGTKGFRTSVGEPVLNFFGDYRKRPQIKAMLDLEFLKHGRAWVRYTNSGDNGLHGFAEVGYKSPFLLPGKQVKVPINGPDRIIIDSMFISNMTETEYYNLRGRSMRQLSGKIENKFELTDKFSLNARVYAKSLDAGQGKSVHRSVAWEYAYSHRFEERVYNYRLILNYNSPFVSLAVGGEHDYTSYGKGWGNDVYLAVVDGGPTDPTNVPTWWSINMGSALGEALLNMGCISTVLKGQHMLLSARIDFAGDFKWGLYSNPLFSPRFAWLGNFEQIGTFKLIAQQSNRLGNVDELYERFLADRRTDAELLRSAELIYQNQFLTDRLHLSFSTYLNSVETVGWSGAKEQTALLGTVDLWGIELDGRFKGERFTVGGNLSFVQMIDAKIERDNRNGLTFADYNYKIKDPGAEDGMILKSEGNNLANVPRTVGKLYGNFNLFKSNHPLAREFTFHGDVHIIADWAGEQDGFKMIEKTAEGTKFEQPVEDFFETLDDHNYRDADIRLNISAEWKLLHNLRINGYIFNLLGTYDNKRYQYSSGHMGLISKKVNWLEEPRAYAIRVSHNF